MAAAEKPDPSLYDIFWTPKARILDKDILTPAKWIELLSSPVIQEGVFCLVLRHRTSRAPPYYRRTPLPPRDNSYGAVRVRHEGRQRAPLDHPHSSGRYQARVKGHLSRAPNTLFISEPVSNEARVSKSKLGRTDHSPTGTASSKDTLSKSRSALLQANRGQLKPHSLPATASSQSEGSDDEQSAREASLEILEISTCPLNLTPFDRGALWNAIVPYNSERLLPWQDDQVGTQASPLPDSRRGRVLIDNSDINLDPKVQPTQSPLNADQASPDDDGIRIIPTQDHPQQDDDGASILHKSRVRSSGESRHVKGTDYNRAPDRLNEVLLETSGTRRHYELNTREKRGERHQKAPHESPGLISFPFFTWRVKQGTEEQSELVSTEERDETVVQILAKVHDSVSADKLSSRDVYITAYRCTADDLFWRHPDMVVETETGGNSEIDGGSGHAGPANDHPTSPGKESSREAKRYINEGWTSSEDDNSDNESSLEGLEMHQSGTQTGEDKKGKGAEDPRNARRDKMAASGLDNSTDPVETRTDHSKFESEVHSKKNQQRSVSFERPSRGQALKTEILETSQSIFRAFLPSQGSSSYPDYYHPVCERFWGSLDDIFRVSSAFHQELTICH